MTNNSKPSITQLDSGTLKRVLGVFDLFAIGYGDLGSSIYYALGVTAFFALGATPLSFLIAGIVFICTALSYAEMSSVFHESGGSASYTRHAFNDLISFTAGWGLLLDYIVTIAISAFTIGPYLAQFYPSLREDSIQIISTIAIILVLLLLNIYGTKESTRTSFFLMVFTIVTQLLIIAIGLFTIEDLTKFFSQITIDNPNQPTVSPSWGQFFKGTAMAMVAYTGIESVAQLSAETKTPKKNVPRAIMITMFVLSFMYLGLSFVGFSVVTPYELGHVYEEQPIAGIVEHLPWGSGFLLPCVGVLAAVTLFVAANAGLMGASRLSFNMGENYQLPRFLYKLHPRFRTPYTALTFFAALACIIVILSRGRMGFLADLYNFGAQIAFFATHASVIALRIQKPDLKRPFKVPLNITIKGKQFPLPAIFGLISSFGVWMLIMITKPEGRYLGIAWIAFGLVMYYLYRKKKQLSPTTSVVIEKIKVPTLKPLKIEQILLPLRSMDQIEMIQTACEMAKLHQAEIKAIHIIEVPFSLPLETALPHQVELAGKTVKTAEAIARDQGVPIRLEVIRARNIAEAIVELAKRESFDLVILASSSREKMGRTISAILPNSPCRLWIVHT